MADINSETENLKTENSPKQNIEFHLESIKESYSLHRPKPLLIPNREESTNLSMSPELKLLSKKIVISLIFRVFFISLSIGFYIGFGDYYWYLSILVIDFIGFFGAFSRKFSWSLLYAMIVFCLTVINVILIFILIAFIAGSIYSEEFEEYKRLLVFLSGVLIVQSFQLVFQQKFLKLMKSMITAPNMIIYNYAGNNQVGFIVL